MKKSKIRDVKTLITKGTTPMTLGGSFTESGINFLKVENVDGSIFLDPRKFYHIDPATHQKMKRSNVLEGDLLVSITGNLGRMAIARASDLPANLNQHVGIVRLDQKLVNNRFLYYYFSLPTLNKYISKMSNQSVQPGLNLEQLGDLEFINFDKEYQDKIADFLYTLDLKILNDKMIVEKLQDLVRTLYGYWFLQFEFPNDQGDPYKSSGGAMKWEDKLGKEIPETWELKTLADLQPILTGKEDANFATKRGAYSFFTCADEVYKCDHYVFEGKAVLLAGNGNFNIKLYEGKFNAYQRTYVLIPNNPKFYTIVYLALQDRIKSLSNGSRGSIVKFITKGDIEGITIALPKKDFDLHYEQLNEITSKIEKAEEEIRKLQELKEFLLPKIMNGEIFLK